MKIDCPHCSASYDLPPEKVPPGRAVRCARCTQLWTPIPLEVAPMLPETPVPREPVDVDVSAPPAAQPDPLPSIAVHKPAPRPSMAERIRLPGAWLITAVVLAVLVWAAVSRRVDIMQAWPPSERAYIALGLAPHS